MVTDIKVIKVKVIKVKVIKVIKVKVRTRCSYQLSKLLTLGPCL